MRDYLRSFSNLYRWDAALFILILLETGFLLSFRKGLFSQEANAWGFTLCGLMVAFVLFFKYFRKKIEVPATKTGGNPWWMRVLPVLLLFAGFFTMLADLAEVFRATPINSGIILTILKAAQRWLTGSWVYAPIEESGFQRPLTDLPLMWIPYALSVLLHVDPRWISCVIYLLACTWVIWKSGKRSLTHGFCVAILCLYLLSMLLKYDASILSTTAELMVGGYYILFIAGMAGRSAWLRGIFIAVCLLSRYSLVLWLPLWAVVEWMSGYQKSFLKSVAVILIIVGLVFVVPFLSQDSGIVMRGYDYYGQTAQLFVCLGSVVLMSFIYAFIRQKIHPRVFLLASFKIYLCLFLGFMPIPYPYLMVTAVAVSIAMFASFSRWRLVLPKGLAQKTVY